MIQIISSFLASVVQKIVLVISYEKVRDGELIKNSKKPKELVDNFSQILFKESLDPTSVSLISHYQFQSLNMSRPDSLLIVTYYSSRSCV